MGFARRVESRRGRSEGPSSRGGVSDRSKRDRSKQGPRHYVRPEELGRKLIKEMESRKVSHSRQQTVCNRFTIFLCPEDHERLCEDADSICRKLERQLEKHARRREYVVFGDIDVRLVMDEDLPLGRFGILAERYSPSVARSLERSPVAEDGLSHAPAPDHGRRRDTVPPPAAAPVEVDPGGTRVIAPEQAAAMGLAHQTIVIRSGGRTREFTKGRVIVGRARDVDFQVNDPNVSRRHAAIYWDDGQIVVQDLDSTNGTMVNGYPVSNTVLRPDDVLVVGECRIRVESR